MVRNGWAHVIAAGGAIISGVSLSQGSISFELLWWVVVAYGVVSLLKTGDARWWLAIGAAIGLGLTPSDAYSFFETCSIAGKTANPYGIQNDESQYHPDILLCGHLRQPWEQLWKDFRYFG